ncbi:MAG TPA: hypothetical protein VFH67_03440 [bacterium]|nr:hypothetical protein [bacterium]
MTPLMNRVREFLKKNPVAGWAIAVGIVSLAGYSVAGRLIAGTTPPAAVPAPALVATPARPTPAHTAAPAPMATPAPMPPLPRVTAPTVVPSGPIGRADPFEPLVRSGIAPPPSGALPPPPFPVPPPPPGVGLPLPPVPGGPITSGGIAVTGIVGNSHAVAVLNIGGRTEIVAEGETIGDLKVLNIDSARRLVQFMRAGKRFEVRMGGE